MNPTQIQFNPQQAFNEAFDSQLADNPSGLPFQASGRPSKAHPHGEDEGWWRSQGPEMVGRWVDWRNSNPWPIWVTPAGLPAIELGLDLPIDGQQVKLYIDRIFSTAPNNLRPVVVDLKSGGPVYGDIQLGLYKVAVELMWPEVAVAGGAYWMARAGTITGVRSLSRFTPRYIGSLMRRLVLARSAGVFLPNVGAHCKACKVGRFCAVNNGSESRFDPDSTLMEG